MKGEDWYVELMAGTTPLFWALPLILWDHHHKEDSLSYLFLPLQRLRQIGIFTPQTMNHRRLCYIQGSPLSHMNADKIFESC